MVKFRPPGSFGSLVSLGFSGLFCSLFSRPGVLNSWMVTAFDGPFLGSIIKVRTFCAFAGGNLANFRIFTPGLHGTPLPEVSNFGSSDPTLETSY